MAGLKFVVNTDLINCGTGANLVDIDPVTYAAWIWLPTNAAASKRLFQRGSGAAAKFMGVSSASSELQADITRATTVCQARAAHTNFAHYGLNKWMFVVGQNDTTTAGNNRLYVGDLNAPCAEPSSYAAQQAGSGAITTNSAASFLVGGFSTFAITGIVAMAGVWKRLLALDELRRLQFGQLRPFLRSAAGLWFPGADGQIATWDLSGNLNHGAITGAVTAAEPFLIVWDINDDATPFSLPERIATFKVA